MRRARYQSRRASKIAPGTGINFFLKKFPGNDFFELPGIPLPGTGIFLIFENFRFPVLTSFFPSGNSMNFTNFLSIYHIKFSIFLKKVIKIIIFFNGFLFCLKRVFYKQLQNNFFPVVPLISELSQFPGFPKSKYQFLDSGEMKKLP